MPGTKQLIDLYFEADRTAVKKRYEETFSVETEEGSAPSKEQSKSPDDTDPDFVAEPERHEIEGEAITHEVLDGEFAKFLDEIAVKRDLCAPLQDRWTRFDLRAKVDAIWHLHALHWDEFGLHYCMEGITFFFGAEESSGLLHALCPDYVFPIGHSYFDLRFILNLYGIQFDDSKGLTKFEVWKNLCDAVEEFATSNKLQPWQVFALVYDLGPRLLPQPSPYPSDPPPKVWMIAVNDRSGEFARVDKHDDEFHGTWPINRKAKRGDLALLYCVSPRSAIVSVYRVIEDAYRDPFSNWTGFRARISECIHIPWIKIGDLRSDPVLGQWKLVKGKMQGLLQVEVPEVAWKRLVEIIAERDRDAGDRLQQFRDAGRGTRDIKEADELWSEKEVEDRFVVPVLQQIGWKLGTTLIPQVQMKIKIGSGKPKEVAADFVGYSGALTSQALLVVEVKRRIASTTELERAVEQAESYSGKQRCRYFAVASPEGFWIYTLQFPGQSQQLHSIEFAIADIEKAAQQLREIIGYEALGRMTSSPPLQSTGH